MGQYMRMILLAFFMLLTPTAFAADRNFEIQCNYDGNQQEINACSVRDYKTADGKLNEIYKEAMSKLPPQKQLSLREEQRAWLKKLDPDCKTKAKSSEGGSIWPLEYYGCLQSSTELRVKELEHWLAGQ